MMDSGCDQYFTKDRRWIAKNNRKELEVILSGGVFSVAAKPSKLLSRKRSALEPNSTSPAGVERATLSRLHAEFGVPGPAARDTLDGDEPLVRIRIPTHKASGHAPCRRWCRWCAAARAADADEPHLREQQPETDEAVSRIEFDSAELERAEELILSTSSLNAFDDGSESSTATLCSTKAFSEYSTERTLAFVEVLGHNVMMLHSDQEPVSGAVVENCAEQTFRPDVGETWIKNQSSESEQD